MHPVAAALAAAAACALGWGWARLARDRPVAPAPDPQVPAVVGPAQLAYAAGYVLGPQALAATLMHQAASGLTALVDGGGTTWTVRGRVPTRRWREADPVSKAVGASLDVEFAGAQFTVGGPASGPVLEEARAYAEATAGRWLATLRAPSAAGVAGFAAVWAAAVVAALLLAFGALQAAVVPGAFAVGGLGLFLERSRSRLTGQGRAVVAAGLGLRRLFAEGRPIPGNYLDLLPHAHAFGFGQRWQEGFAAATGQAPPAPPWCSVDGWGPGSAEVADFAAVVAHAFEPQSPGPPPKDDGMYAGWV